MSRNLAIVGPTACGKSQVAIELAAKIPNTEIISLDSMQIYSGMEIGTGVVPIDDRKNIKHHMISIIEPTTNYNVKDFQKGVNTILDSNKAPSYILVGGTGLYTHAVVDGFIFAPSSEEVRQQIIKDYQLDEDNPVEKYVNAAYETLIEFDMQAAEKIDPKNVRRIIRALEAIEISGDKFSSSGKGVQTFEEPKIDVEMVGLRFSRENLRERIVLRVKEMFENGWIDEVKNLANNWERIVAPARNAIGYMQIYNWIQSGEKISELDDLQEIIVNKTVQFSRRQRKWFERDPRITWIECDNMDLSEIINQIFTSTKS